MPSLIDVTIVVVYLVVTIIIGIACRGRQETEEDYFTGRGGFKNFFGSLLIGLSIAATFFSGISMLAYPSVAYKTGPSIGIAAIIMPMAGLPVLIWFIPYFLKRCGREPYEVVEREFGYPTRAMASIMFVLLRMGWMGALIFAPTAALMAAFQLHDGWFWPLVLLVGLSSTFYTALGGLRGVIVTDSIQLLVMVLGILWPLIHVLTHLPVGIVESFETLQNSGRWTTINTAFSFTQEKTLWGIFFGFMVANVGIYVADQMSLQRYMASESVKAAQQAFLINIIGIVFVTIILTVLGLAMAAWYGPGGHIAPENADHVFPHFVITVLPQGAPGIIFAAIIAATMSSMTSGINALAGAISLDFSKPIQKHFSAEGRLKFARWLSVVIGLLATATAGLVRSLGSIFDIAQSVIGVFLGPLLICVAFAVFQIRVGGATMIIGMIAGTAAGWCVIFSPMDSLWVAPTSAAVCALISLSGLLFASRSIPVEVMPENEAS
ncbi:MAG TPA: hypothetical protein VNQ76_22090 [Planctomicrobium sp.]|nr:hypothetical protein [Planctomicrobium sp.]